MTKDVLALWELEVEYAKELKHERMQFLRDRKVDMYRKLEEIMDVQEKRTLVTNWFHQFGKENGFEQTSVVEDVSGSGLTLILRKSEFPTIESSVVITDSLLQSTSPRELMHTYLPLKGRELIAAWSHSLHQDRRSRSV